MPTVLVGKTRSVLKLPPFVSESSLVCFIDGIVFESNFICIGHLSITMSKLGSIDEVENGTKISLLLVYFVFPIEVPGELDPEI